MVRHGGGGDSRRRCRSPGGPGAGTVPWSCGFVDRVPVDGGSPAALDERAVTEFARSPTGLGDRSGRAHAARGADGRRRDGRRERAGCLRGRGRGGPFSAAVGTGVIGVAALAQHAAAARPRTSPVATLRPGVRGVLGCARSSLRPLLLVSDDGRPDGVILTLASTSVWQLRRTGLREARSVEVAGPVPGYVVVRVPGHDTLASARPPLLARDERRWRRTLVRARKARGTCRVSPRRCRPELGDSSTGDAPKTPPVPVIRRRGGRAAPGAVRAGPPAWCGRGPQGPRAPDSRGSSPCPR